MKRLPGLLTWMLLLLPFALAYAAPETGAVFFVLFCIFWLLRSLSYSYHLLRSFLIYRKQKNVHWNHICESPESYGSLPHVQASFKHLPKDTSNTALTFSEVRHILIVATYKEPLEVLKETFDSVKASHYDLKHIHIVLATEVRDKANAALIAAELKELYGHYFGSFLVTVHPKDIPGEVAGKGGNITFAARECVNTFRKQGILTAENERSFVVTTLDADNKVHQDYFSVLSCTYIASPDRQHASYQPLPFLYNNIWDVPLLVRVVAISATFWHLIESGRSDKLRNFSSHAQPLKALIDMDFWSTSTIVEDGHQFWRSYVHFRGKYRVIPLFIPIYQDAVQSESFGKNLIAQYKQLRRWAHGAEDISYTWHAFKAHWHELPKLKTMFHWFNLLEGHLMWASAPLVLTLTTLTFYIINPGFTESAIFYQFSTLLSTLFTVALIGIAVSICMSLLLLPPIPTHASFGKKLYYLLSQVAMWILLPITTVFLAAIPAIEAQTRLLFGKDLGFQVTKKTRS